MCIVEYLGYVCGHSSIHVHRPCPLTTHLGTNPACPNPAKRPTLVDANCPTCARILHTRWVEIVTLEHQWMHERGTCGCQVRFPAMQQPRLVSEVQIDRSVSGNGDRRNDRDGSSLATFPTSSDTTGREQARSVSTTPAVLDRDSFSRTRIELPAFEFEEERDDGKEGNNGNSIEPLAQSDLDETCRPKSKSQKKTRTKKNKKSKDNAQKKKKQQQRSTKSDGPTHCLDSTYNYKTISPPREIADSTGDPPSNKKSPSTTIAICLSSQYGAEWMTDHGELHLSGKCSCAVRFDTYKPYKLTRRDIAEYAPDLQIGIQNRALQKPIFTEADLEVWRKNEQAPSNEQIEWPVRLSDMGFNSVVDAEAWLASEGARARAMSAGDGPMYQQISPVDMSPAHDMYTPTDQSFLVYSQIGNEYDYEATMGGYSQAPDLSPTFNHPLSSKKAMYHSLKRRKKQVEIEMNKGNIAITATTGRPEYYQDHGPPLIGWPLGAGPEGGAKDSHSPAWDMCILSRPALERTQSCPDLAAELSKLRL